MDTWFLCFAYGFTKTNKRFDFFLIFKFLCERLWIPPIHECDVTTLVLSKLKPVSVKNDKDYAHFVPEQSKCQNIKRINITFQWGVTQPSCHLKIWR